MAKKNILDVILNTINDVQNKNKANPREQTVDPNVFDIIKAKLNELDGNIKNKQVQKGKNPVSILDLIKGQLEAAKQQTKADSNILTPPDSIFDRINKKVEERPRRTASTGLKKVVEEYNLDVRKLSRPELQNIVTQYDNDLKKMNRQYAEHIHKRIQDSYFK